MKTSPQYSNHMPVAEWADARQISEAMARQWCERAHVKPSAKGMSPTQWMKLDRYVYATCGKTISEPL